MKNIENFTLNFMNIHELRDLARFVGVETPTMYDKDELIKQIKIQRAKNEKVEDSKPRRGRPPKNKYEETFNSKDGNWILEELKKKALKKIERMQKSKNNKKLKEIEERENFNLEEYFAQQKIDEEQKIYDEQNYKAENTILNENDNINHNETNLNVDIKEQEDSTIVIENDNQKKNKDNDNTQTDEDDEELEDAKFIKETRYKTFTDDQLLTQNIYHDDALLDEMLLKPEVTLNTSSTEFDEMPNDTYQAAGYFKSFGLNRYFVFCDDKYDLEEAILVPKNIVAKYNFRTGDYIEFYYKLYLGVGLKFLYKVINKSDFVNQSEYENLSKFRKENVLLDIDESTSPIIEGTNNIIVAKTKNEYKNLFDKLKKSDKLIELVQLSIGVVNQKFNIGKNFFYTEIGESNSKVYFIIEMALECVKRYVEKGRKVILIVNELSLFLEYLKQKYLVDNEISKDIDAFESFFDMINIYENGASVTLCSLVQEGINDLKDMPKSLINSFSINVLKS